LTYQVVGVYDSRYVHLIAECLRILGRKRACVVYGEDGQDELSLASPSVLAVLQEDGRIERFSVEPEDFGVSRFSKERLILESQEEQLEAFQRVIEGNPSPWLELVALNAGLALFVCGLTGSIKGGYGLAKEALLTRSALGVFERFKKRFEAMTPFLPEVVKRTLADIEAKKAKEPLVELEKKLSSFAKKSPVGLFSKFLDKEPDTKLICEIKRASPSRGVLLGRLDVRELAQVYEGAGAFALSVLTQPLGFHGSLRDLEVARQAFGGPILRKDFILDVYQLYETALAGADLVLLIVRILSKDKLEELVSASRSLGLLPLVELHSEEDLDKVSGLEGPLLLGLNARDLASLTIDHERVEALLREPLGSYPVVIESGIDQREQVLAYKRHARVCAFLVGEGILKSSDPAGKIRELTGGKT